MRKLNLKNRTYPIALKRLERQRGIIAIEKVKSRFAIGLFLSVISTQLVRTGVSAEHSRRALV